MANTEGFEKSTVLMARWMDIILRVMQKERNFRIEVNYNAEASKAVFAVYTPASAKEDDSIVIDNNPEGTEPDSTPAKFQNNVIFGIEEHPEIKAIEIFPIRPKLILYGEREIRVLIETLKKYLHE